MKQHITDTVVWWLLDGLEVTGKNKGLSEQPSKYQTVFKGLMAPSGRALEHPAAPVLLELSTLGCTADIVDSWTMEMLEAAIAKGADPSAMVPEAATQLHDETMEKVAQGDTPGSSHGRN